MSPRQRKPVEYWKEVIEDFLKSGKSQKQYSQDNKISRATLWMWSNHFGISLNRRGKTSPKVDKDLPLTFTDVQILGRPKVSPLLKIEIIFSQGHTLKLEIEESWKEAGTFIKALVG